MNTQAHTPTQWMPILPQLDNDHVTRILLTLTLFAAANFIIFTPAWIMDSRILDSASVWTKPQKFNVSFVVHFGALALLAQQLPRKVRAGKAMTVAAYLAAVSVVFEYIYLNTQAARGRRSHFNYDSVFEQAMYAGMGVAAVGLIAVCLVLAVQLWRKGERTRSRGLWLGTIVGMSLGFFATLYFGFTMSATSRYVGSALTGGGEVVPFFGWSREYGDLRPAHFVSMHLMQTIPLAGWIADRRGWNAKLVVFGVTAAQIALATFLYVQAQSGQPFWPI